LQCDLSAYIILAIVSLCISELLFWQVGFIVSSIDAYLSQTMYSTIVNLPRMKETNLFKNSVFDNTKTHVPKKLALNVSVSLKLAKLGLHVDLDGNFEESSGLIVGIEDIDIRLIIGYRFCNIES
jgi:hypothetical protein